MKDLFVTVPPSLQELLTQELEQLGIPKIRQGFSGVFVPKEMAHVYTINYRSRFATRVLFPFAQFPCRTRDDLYYGTFRVIWPEIFSVDKSFAIDANVSSQTLRHSLFAAQVMKDALCDRFRKECGERPSVNVESPDIQLNLFVHQEMATISFDTSGSPLYKRGWREQTGIAPLQESLAAAALALANYSADDILCDPFCGSGTLLIEAAHFATQTPSGFFRKNWGFFHMPFFSQTEWEKVKQEADSKRHPLKAGTIFGADKDPKVLEMCQKNLSDTKLSKAIDLSCKDVRSYFPASPPNLIVSNPPYGKRMKSSAEIFQAFGHFLKTKCAKNFKAFILCPEKELIQNIGFPISNETSFVSGGLDLTLFELQNT
jgi:putative N6-adenine-specific DNA methylase